MTEGDWQLELVSESPERTLEIGRNLGAGLPPGSFVALCGPLGAGKTQLAKGVALGLGIDESTPIVSPTFVLVREYGGRQRLVHADVYRLCGADELVGLGLEERIEAGDIVVVEWADRFSSSWPSSAIWIELSHAGVAQRRIRIRSPRLRFGAL